MLITEFDCNTDDCSELLGTYWGEKRLHQVHLITVKYRCTLDSEMFFVIEMQVIEWYVKVFNL